MANRPGIEAPVVGGPCDLTESELWSGLDREAPEIVDHIAHCDACQIRAKSFQTGIHFVATASLPPLPPPPQTIGPYVIHKRIGEGGMGIVYEAEQQAPRRLVAIKVVRGGPQVDEYRLRLFEREAQTLGRLRHPLIAAVFEGGRTSQGEHFFAMELVHGTPLNVYVRDFKIPRRQRLVIFQQICHAIHYAHQRGVIHRDLKPSNILVDAEGKPKILDFGLARITDPDATGATVTYEIGRIMGTLPYMSPEEVRGDVAAIDVRSDVYSLGVIFYEILTDRLPYSVRRAALPEAIRTICEEVPRRAGALDPTLRGDLEMIAARALEKDPNRRYQSPAALAEDIERYLTHQPVLARRGNAIYRMGKLIARHRLPAIIITGLLAVFLMSSLTLTHLARVQRTGVESTLASKDLRVATIENRLADLHFERGEYTQAEPVYRSALQTFLHLQRDSRAAPVMVTIATILIDRRDATEKELREAAGMLHDAAKIYRRQGTEALDQLRKVYTLLLQVYGPDRLDDPDALDDIESEFRNLDLPRSARRPSGPAFDPSA